MKQQFVVTDWYTVLQETKIESILNRPALKHVMFLWKCNDKQFFCGHNVLNECVFVTHLRMQKSQFDKLCVLQQIVVSCAICYNMFMGKKAYINRT
jgi:hypothetical protein